MERGLADFGELPGSNWREARQFLEIIILDLKKLKTNITNLSIIYVVNKYFDLTLQIIIIYD